MSRKHSTGLIDSASSGSSEELQLGTSDDLFKKVEELFLGGLLESNYLIESSIGKGSSSVVFAATDIKNLSKVAVKVLIRDLDSAGKRVDRFNQETRTTRFLRHENILDIYSYGIEKNHAYFVMEYLESGSLADLLTQKERLSQNQTIEIIQQVSSALSFAHKQGVIHRDVKPSNIIFKDKNHKLVKLVDFGMSTRLGWDYSNDVFRTPTGEIYGTTLYISPEQSKGNKADQKTDVYSLGCVFYECLTGMPPHTGKTAIDIVVKHQNDEIIPINEAIMSDVVSVEIQTIVDKMLRKNPKDRYQNIDLILRDFENLEKGEFNHKMYIRPPKQELKMRKVYDFSNFVFVLAILIVIATFWLAYSLLVLKVEPEFLGVNGPTTNINRTIFETTNDRDLREIKKVTIYMFDQFGMPEVNIDKMESYYTKRWGTNDSKLLKKTWDNRKILYRSVIDYNQAPVGKLELESIDKVKGSASTIVDTSPWIESGPKFIRLKFKRVAGFWLIDEVQNIEN